LPINALACKILLVKLNFNPNLTLPLKHHKMKTTTKPILTLIIIAATCLIYLSSCIKPFEPTPQIKDSVTCDTCLPPITTTGPTSFGCRINGKVWLPKDGFNQKMFADYYDSTIYIVGTNGEAMERVSFSLQQIIDTGTFEFPNNLFSYSAAGFRFINLPITENFYSIPISKGKIQFLRFDIDSGKFSGTFEFDVYSNDFKDTLHITDGRFHINK